MFGLIKYRAYLYELFRKNNYQYRKYDEAIVGEEYHKIIKLFNEDIVNAYILWNMLKEKTIALYKSSLIGKHSFLSKKHIRFVPF